MTILPQRLTEGYGFQPLHVVRAVADGCKLIVTVDCGSSSVEAIVAARESGLEVIVTDHHIPSEILPTGALMINPLQDGDTYPYERLSGAGLAFKLSVAMFTRCAKTVPLAPLLRVACLGTIADLVPLNGENRVIAALGLASLASSRSPGLRALMKQAGVKRPVRASDVGFKIGPRLNASGRLDSPDEALELLMTRDENRAEVLAVRLDELNRERQTEEAKIVEQARERVLAMADLPGVLVLWSDEWHKGVVGIAASRIAREFHRPTLLLGVEGETATGSGRSIPGIHLHHFIEPWRDRLERFGGHAQAIGLTVAIDRLEDIRKSWQTGADWQSELLIKRLSYELDLRPCEVTSELLGELEELRPFGEANRQPLLRVGPLEVSGSLRKFGKGHISGTAHGEDGATVRILGWNWQDRAEMFDRPFEVVARLEWDSFLASPVLQMQDARSVPRPTAVTLPGA
jgi:single-stranded-DNA-specific exonuclease